VFKEYDVKVGDELWSVRHGWGKVKNISKIGKSSYPICVKFICGEVDFTKDFRELDIDLYQSLFWDEIKFEIPKKPLPKLKINTVLKVWDIGDEDVRIRHFSHFNDGLYCFKDGKTSYTGIRTKKWDNYEIVKEEI
jgi:hypothetical protein